MAVVNKMPLNWHQINQRAAQLAGNSAIVQKAQQIYHRYPGLNICVVERLGFANFDANSAANQSKIYGADYGRLESSLGRLIPQLQGGGELEETYNLTMKDYIFSEIDTGRGVFRRYTDATYREKIAQNYKGPAKQRPLNAVVFDHGETLTRNEILARFAGLDTKSVKLPDDITVAEVHRLVRLHEMQHGRNGQTYDYAFWGATKTDELQEESLAYKALHNKFQGTIHDNNAGDPYRKFIDETLADTAAALHHLKAGGSESLVQALADARASSFIETAGKPNAPRIYGAHVVLDKILQNKDIVDDMLAMTHENDVDTLAVSLVGDFVWNRSDYYAHAYGAFQVKLQDLAFQPDSAEKSEAIVNINEQMSRLVTGHGDEAQLSQRASFLTAQIRNRAVNAQHELTKNGPVTPEDHLVEVRAMVKYNQAQHPELATPAGEQYILNTRQRCIAEPEHKIIPHPQEADVADILRQETAHRASQEMGGEKRQEISQSL